MLPTPMSVALICVSDSLIKAFSNLTSFLYTMIPAVLTTAMPERATVTPACKASSSSLRFCRSKVSKVFYCKICLSECPNKKGQNLDGCSCIFCREVCRANVWFFCCLAKGVYQFPMKSLYYYRNMCIKLVSKLLWFDFIYIVGKNLPETAGYYR